MADYEVQILVRGKPIKMFKHKGEFYVEGRKGSNFELKFINNTWRNIEVVPSVDGLSVLNGEACGEASEGYLVPYRDSVTIPGWRLNNDSVAEFIFNDKNRSYSSQTGEGTTNVGVIGFMVFAEKAVVCVPPIHPWPHPQPYYNGIRGTDVSLDISNKGFGSITTSDNFDEGLEIHNMASSASVSATTSSEKSTDRRINLTATSAVSSNAIADVDETFNLGTGWGDEVGHKVSVVEFERHNPTVADELIAVYYDTRRGLEARGIKVVKAKKKKSQDLPNAFPTYSETGCQPPSGWKGKRR